jgi:hypothetical protein
MKRWRVVGLLCSLGVASVAHAHATSGSSMTAARSSLTGRAASLPREPEGSFRPRRKAVRLGGDMPCIAPQLLKEDHSLGAFQNVPAAGGTFTLLVLTQTAEQCGRALRETSDFIVDLQGSGTEKVTYTVLPNTGAARTAVLVGSSGPGVTSTFEVRQAAGTQGTTPAPTPPSDALSNDPSVLGAQRTCGKVALTTVKSGAILKPNTWVLSPSRQYKLIYQTDGNLVLYRASGEAAWANGKLTPGGRVTMQTDGNLVSYDSANKALWASRTMTKGSYLAVQDDGNVVVYGPDSCKPFWAIR